MEMVAAWMMSWHSRYALLGKCFEAVGHSTIRAHDMWKLHSLVHFHGGKTGFIESLSIYNRIPDFNLPTCLLLTYYYY